jgi:hypothetical protein
MEEQGQRMLRARRLFVDALDRWCKEGFISDFSQDDVQSQEGEWSFSSLIEYVDLGKTEPEVRAALRRAVYSFAEEVTKSVGLELVDAHVKEDAHSGHIRVFVQGKERNDQLGNRPTGRAPEE